MSIDLSPKLAKKLYGGNGGAYYAWCPQELHMLKEGNIGASKLVLENFGLALPRYSDSAKVAYVLQGYEQNFDCNYRYSNSARSLMLSSSPVFTHLAGRTSVWKALSPQVLQASFNVTEDIEQLFRSKRTADEIFFPPSK